MLLVLWWLASAMQARAGDVVLFPSTAQVWIDAQGVPTRVRVSERVPALVRERIAEQVAGWRFESGQAGGTLQAGMTHVTLSVCAAKGEQGELRVATHYVGNGPGCPNGLPVMPPPAYPREAIDIGGAWNVVITVQTDGRTVVESITPEKEGQRGKRYFERALGEWARDMVFSPEQVGDQPVSTRLRIPVNFAVGLVDADDVAREKREVEASSAACMAANGSPQATQPVAIDSPFRILETGG